MKVTEPGQSRNPILNHRDLDEKPPEGFIDRNTYTYRINENGEKVLIKVTPPEDAVKEDEIFTYSEKSLMYAQRKPYETRTCKNPNCGKEFRTQKKNKLYCSIPCQRKYHTEKLKERGYKRVGE